jgi:FkbM family methyltransferase
MLTIFSTCRRFEGIFGTIQTNALESWTRLEPRPQIIILGDDAGTAEICEELGLTHVPAVATSDLGTPLVSDMFARAQELAEFDTCCFINSDIILLPETGAVVESARARFGSQYLVVGQRHDLAITTVLPFEDGWADELRDRARQRGKLRSEILLDYFIFPTGQFKDLPPFAIGRSAYDNWIVWHAGDIGAAVIDATRALTVIHQNHDYSHAGGMAAVWEGPEARRAHEMIGHWSRYHAVAHARFMFTDAGQITPARGMKYRMARPRRVASHALRFTRPWRRRLTDFRQTAWSRVRRRLALQVPVPSFFSKAVVVAAGPLASTRAGRVPGYVFGQVVMPSRARLRLGIWAIGRFAVLDRPVVVTWTEGLRVNCWLGNDTSRCLYVGGAFEPNEVAFFAETLDAGMHVVDAGANEGLYSTLASRRVGSGGRVLAIEPSSRERRRLVENLDRNACSNVEVVPVALADVAGESVLHVADAHHGGQNTFGDFVYEAVGHAADETVTTLTLDEVLAERGWERLDVMKADVEGAEVRLLDGASDTLRRLRPVLLLESQDDSLRLQGSSLSELFERLAAHDYAILPFDDATGRPTTLRSATVDDPNIVACPREQLGRLAERGLIDLAVLPAES